MFQTCVVEISVADMLKTSLSFEIEKVKLVDIV